MSTGQLAYLGSRTIQENGGCVVVSIPTNEFREQFGIEPTEIAGEEVTTQLFSDGKYQIDLSSIEDIQ